MQKSEVLGTLQLGGLRYLTWRDGALLLLFLYSWYFFRFNLALIGLKPSGSLLGPFLFFGAGLCMAIWALARIWVSEEVSIDFERGQVVKQRKLLGVEQLVPVANLESIVSVAMAGEDLSLGGNSSPVWVGYLVTSQGRCVPVAVEKRAEEFSLKTKLQSVAEKLGAPFRQGPLEARLSVDSHGALLFQERPRRVLALRSVLIYPALITILGFFGATGLVFWHRFLP